MNVGRRLSVIPFVFIWTILMGSVRAKLDAYFTKMVCVNHMPELLKNVSCHLDQASHANSSFSIELALAKTVTGVNGTYSFGVKRGSIVSNYITMEINYCEALEAIYSNYLMKMISEELRRAGNFPHHCPFQKNTPYRIKDYVIDTRMIPSYVPEINFVSDCMIKIDNKNVLQLILSGRVIRRRSGR